MKEEELRRLLQFEERYWWHVGRRRLIAEAVRRFVCPSPQAGVLDIGCGAGRNLVDLACAIWRITGLDRALEMLALARETLDGVVCGDAVRLPFRTGSLDLVTAFDELEHIDDDLAALREMRRLLRPGGRLLLTVPAYRFLWSGHDEALGHRRRYTASELHQKLTVTGFRVLKRTYCVTLLFPIIAAFRVWQGLFPQVTPTATYVMLPRWLNVFFAWLLSVEAVLIRAMNLPFGSSILIVGERRPDEVSGAEDL